MNTPKNIREFIKTLDNEKDIVYIDTPVSSYLEIAEIHRRVIAANGPALFFRNVIEKPYPVVTNLFGSKKRVELAFGKIVPELLKQAARLPHDPNLLKLKSFWKNRHLLLRGLKLGSKQKKYAPILANQISKPDLTTLPALTTWPEDGGPFLTLPLVQTKSPLNHADNLGMYRIQIHSPQETGMHFQIGKGGAFHLHEAESQGLNLPCHTSLGGPPALILSAITPLPESISEILLCSFLLGQKVPVTSHPTSPLSVFAESEFCLLGEVLKHQRKPEGPFGDHYGYYSLKHDYPVFKVHTMVHRDNPIFPATVVGKPNQEDFFLGNYLQNLLKPIFPHVMPGVKDIFSYGETGFHSLSAAVFKERYSRESLASVFRVLGEGQLSLTKFLIAIHEDINLENFKSLLEYILERVEWKHDLFIFSDTAMDSLDYCGPKINLGSKGALIVGPRKLRHPPQRFDALTAKQISHHPIGVFCKGCLVIESPEWQIDQDYPRKILKSSLLQDWQLIVFVDDVKKTLSSTTSFLWTTFTRFEPATDLIAKNHRIKRNRVEFEGPVAIDARMKPWYPSELFCDEQTANKVTSRWKQYFPHKKIAMGSSDFANLQSS